MRPEREFAYAGRDVEAVHALNAEGLQGNAALEATDEGVSVKPDAHGRARCGAAVVTRQGSVARMIVRRDNLPDQHARLLIADVDADLGNASLIAFKMILVGEGAPHLVRRPKYKAPATGLMTGQRADFDAGLSMRSEPEPAHQGGAGKKFVHL